MEQPGDLKATLTEALTHPSPALADVRVHRQELSLPPTITLDQATGFNLYAIKAIFSGRGDEILDMAKTNLRQVLTTFVPGLGGTHAE